MEHTIVTANSLVKYNRMDAGFHVALSKVADRVKELESKISAKDAIARLIGLQTNDLHCLEPLTIGSSPKLTREMLIRAIESYPHISYAIVEQNIALIKERAQAEVNSATAYALAANKLKVD